MIFFKKMRLKITFVKTSTRWNVELKLAAVVETSLVARLQRASVPLFCCVFKLNPCSAELIYFEYLIRLGTISIEYIL